LLVALAPHLTLEQLEEALSTAKRIKSIYYRSKIVTALVPHLRGKERDQALGEAIVDAKNIIDRTQQSEILAELLCHVQSHQKIDTILALVEAASGSSRLLALSVVKTCAAATYEIEGEEAVLELCRAVKDTCRWFP
jgi:hypothetical protein